MKLLSVFRDEQINIFAMTHGNLGLKYSHQIFVCKNRRHTGENTGPYFLDMKKKETNFKLSQFGESYLKYCHSIEYANNYIAFIDSRIDFTVKPEVFDSLCNNGFFSIWHSEAPLKYFSKLKNKQNHDFKEGYLILFRVYKIANSVPEDLLIEGRNGPSYFFKLSREIHTEVIEPVISDHEFNKMKTGIIDLLKSGGWFHNLSNFSYDLPASYSEKLLEANEDVFFQEEVESISVTMVDAPKDKPEKKGNISNSSYTRNPATSKRAIINSKYCCEVDSQHKSFTSKVTKHNYVEAHHLIPMEYQDDFNVSIDVEANIVSLCVSCHKRLHHAVFSEKKELLESLYAQRIKRLEKCGINIKLDSLYKYYKK